jgi:azurin
MSSSTLAQTAPPARTITLQGTDQMRYSVATIQAKPGERLRVRLTTVSAMPKAVMAHNFVLLQAGTTAAQQLSFAEKAAMARTTDYIPTDAELKKLIVANTTLAGAGETVEVTFQVPNVEGSFPYLCSFPGHFVGGMRGTLQVAK